MTIITIRKHRLLISDLVISFGSVWLSYLLRLGSISFVLEFIPQIWVMSVSALILKPVVFKMLGIYRIYWKYIGLRELTKLAASSTLGSTAVAVVLVILISIQIGLPAAFPRSVVAIDWVISTSLFLLFRRVSY